MECKEEACSRTAESGHRGWCGGHYARWRTGRPVAGPLRSDPPQECSHEGCLRPSRAGNTICKPHQIAEWRAARKLCTEPGCENQGSHGQGLCGKHYAQIVRAAADRPRCSVNGCAHPAVSQTYCTMHYQRWAKAGEPGEVARRKAANYQPTDLCKVPECGRQARAAGYCTNHHRRFRRFGITHTEFEGLLRRQRGQCAICHTGKPGASGEWCIDHDHVTGQIRGLLCSRCNSGIGMLQDDPKIISAAAQYVSRHRQMELFSRKAG